MGVGLTVARTIAGRSQKVWFTRSPYRGLGDGSGTEPVLVYVHQTEIIIKALKIFPCVSQRHQKYIFLISLCFTNHDCFVAVPYITTGPRSRFAFCSAIVVGFRNVYKN